MFQKFQWVAIKQASKQAHFGQIEKKREKNTFRNQGLVQVFKCISNILCS
jgi:hypothetical protein